MPSGVLGMEAITCATAHAIGSLSTFQDCIAKFSAGTLARPQKDEGKNCAHRHAHVAAGGRQHRRRLCLAQRQVGGLQRLALQPQHGCKRGLNECRH
jgi:hypothetical protein